MPLRHDRIRNPETLHSEKAFRSNRFRRLRRLGGKPSKEERKAAPPRTSWGRQTDAGASVPLRSRVVVG